MSDNGNRYGPSSRYRYGPGSARKPGPPTGPGPGTSNDAAAGPDAPISYGPGSSQGPESGSSHAAASVRANGSAYGPGSLHGDGPAGHPAVADHGGLGEFGGSDESRGERTTSRAKRAGLVAAAIAVVGCITGIISAGKDIREWLWPDTPVIVNQAPPPARPPPTDATIDITYSGTTSSCTFGVVVNIGGTQAVPSGTRYTMRHVPLGQQGYTATGVINCGTYGGCQVSTDGTVEVVDGRSYAVAWKLVDNGNCTLAIVG